MGVVLSCGCKFEAGDDHAEYWVEFDDWHYPRTLEQDGSVTNAQIGTYTATWCGECVKSKGPRMPNFKASKIDE